jgi:hypothetical protein
MTATYAIPISDIVSEYYWGFADNNSLAEIVLSDDSVLEQHIEGLIRPLCGYCSITEYLEDPQTQTMFVDLRVPPDPAMAFVRQLVSKLQMRVLTCIGDLPYHGYWDCQLQFLPEAHALLFKGGHSVKNNRVRRAPPVTQNQPILRQPFVAGSNIYGPMLQGLGNATVARDRLSRRLTIHDRKLSDAIPETPGVCDEFKELLDDITR